MRLKSDFIISAALRKADRLAISAFIHKKGDPDAGAIFLELESDRDSVQLLHRRFDFDENEEIYSFSCRCGDCYEIEYEDLLDGVQILSCNRINDRPTFTSNYPASHVGCESFLGSFTIS